MGRVDVRLLVLLAMGVLLGTLAWAAVQLTKEQTDDFDARTLNTWRDLIGEFTRFRESSYPLVIPALLPDESSIDWAALQNDDPEWYWDFDAGTYYFDPGSELSKQIPHDTDLLVYEDIVEEELLVLNVPKTADAPYKEEMVFRAMAWPQPSKFERYQRYLDRELCKRRIVWHITMKSRRLAEKEETQPRMAAILEGPQAFLPANSSSMQMMSMESLTELKITGIRKATNSLLIEVSYPASYSGTSWSVFSYDMPACVYTNESGGSGGNPQPPTNDAPCEGCSTCYTDPERSFAGLDRVWMLSESNLVLTGETSTLWLDTRALGLDTNGEPCHRIYALGANSVDEDNDQINSAFELFALKTDPAVWDSDGDGVGDGAELANDTSPTNPNDPPNANGAILYSGAQTGVVRVLAVTISNSWTSAYTDTLNEPGSYQIANLLGSNLWLKAFRDLDGDGVLDEIEARGEYTGNPAEIGQQVNGIDITLSDPDTDGDGFSDFEELYHLGTNPSDPADGAVKLQETKDQVSAYWNIFFRDSLSFTNTPGSAADLNDLRNALNTLSEQFHEAGMQ
ncbi:MAG: hypothetical protein A2X46_17315 [Lentisphaerae bacterium GWF2_57_35]|nr:MAG: hypothetical protein A2X46_17315 [Lentisphaerae bacterium GWF2_57_35]